MASAGGSAPSVGVAMVAAVDECFPPQDSLPPAGASPEATATVGVRVAGHGSPRYYRSAIDGVRRSPGTSTQIQRCHGHHGPRGQGRRDGGRRKPNIWFINFHSPSRWTLYLFLHPPPDAATPPAATAQGSTNDAAVSSTPQALRHGGST